MKRANARYGARKIGTQSHLRGAAAFLLLFGSISPLALHAQTDRSVENTSFEANDPPGNPGFRIYANGQVPGWTSDSGAIEIWDTGFQGVPSQDGNRHIEINANSPANLYQEVCLINGETLDWTFHHRARSGGSAVQTTNFEVANASGGLVQTLGVSSVSDTTQWTTVNAPAGQTFTGPTGLYRMQFRTVASGSVGNFLDNVDFGVRPFIEFKAASSISRETATSADALTILVSGNIATAFDVDIVVSGGTATLGSDFTTPSGTSTFSVTIPAGDYTQLEIPVGISLLTDPDAESDETIELSIVSNALFFIPASTYSCGSSPNATSVHTITHETDLVTLKSLASGNTNPVPGETVSFSILVRNDGPDPASGVSLTDLLPAGLTPTGNNGQVTTGNYDASTGIWDLGGLAAGATAELTLEGTVDGGQPDAVITNTTTAASGVQTDPTNDGNDLTESVTVARVADLVVTKSNGADDVTSGSSTTYSIVVTSAGPDPITGAIVTDTPGAGITCEATAPVTITGDGVPAGSFTFADLSGAGIVLGTLSTGQSTTLSYSCQVN